MLDLWLFSIDNNGRSLRSAIAAEIDLPSDRRGSSETSSLEPRDHQHNQSTQPSSSSTKTRVVFAGEKKRGGLRILDSRLVHDVAIAPVPPPHVHAEYSASLTPRGQSNVAPNIAISMALCSHADDLWIGWSSGHISVLNTRRPPVIGDGLLSAEHYRRDELPRYVDWDDLLYAHRGAVHLLSATHQSRFIVSASYDTNIIIWETSTRRQLRSLSGAAKQAAANDSSHLLSSSSSGSLSGICRTICEVPVDVSEGSRDLAPVGLLAVLDGGAQVLFHGVEGLLLDRQGGDAEQTTYNNKYNHHNNTTASSSGALEVAQLQSCPFVASAAASVFDTDACVAVLCRGDESARIHFTSVVWGSSAGANNESFGDNKWATSRRDHSFSSAPVLRSSALSAMDEIAASVSLGSAKQLGKILSIVPTGLAPLPQEEGHSSTLAHYVCGFIVTTAHRFVGLVECTVCVARPGMTIVATRVNALQAVPSPMTMVVPASVTTQDLAAGCVPALQLYYGIGVDGSVSAVLAFRPDSSHTPGARALHHRSSVVAGSASRTHGDFLREQSRLKNAVELVQNAKNSTLLADAMLQEGIQKQAELTDDNKRLRARIDELEQSLHHLHDRGVGLEGKLDSAESTAESTRTKLTQANSEIKRLTELLKVAAADQRKTVTALDEATERETLNAMKVQECLLQMEQQKELIDDNDKVLSASQGRTFQLSTRCDVLAAKVVELERLLANQDDEEQRDMIQSHATRQQQHVLLDEQQEIIQELKTRYHTSVRDLASYKQSSERLQDEVTYWKSQYESTYLAAQQTQLEKIRVNAMEKLSNSAVNGNFGRSHSPIQPTRSAAAPVVLSLSRDGSVAKHTTTTQQRLESLSSRLSSEHRRTVSPPHRREGSGSDAGLTSNSKPSPQLISGGGTNIGDEYLKTLAPPVRSASSATSGVASAAGTKESTGASPTDLRYVSGGHSHLRGPSSCFGPRSAGESNSSAVRSVTVALSS
ncbi:Hypothetical protein, putative [Bodo saltans]|uniref:Uncharacterized protein n=1 Tax=Bodo saltans TaxID=75058 RepID=A0A0S4JTY0_BODSA|nr:Hypothetical protein, putative [Bodo saltans]|eukprot:CUG93469.1 Hypothetical protein, putative [Bodo saltans]